MGAEPPPDLKHGVLHGVEAVVGRRAPNGLIDLLFCDRNVRVGIEQVEDTKLLFRQGDCLHPYHRPPPCGLHGQPGGAGGNPPKGLGGEAIQPELCRQQGKVVKGLTAAEPLAEAQLHRLPAGRFPTVKEEKLNGGRAAAGRDMRQAAEAAAAQKDLRGVDAGFRRRLSPVQAQARGGQPRQPSQPGAGHGGSVQGDEGGVPVCLVHGPPQRSPFLARRMRTQVATRTAARSNSPTGLRAAGPDGASISPLFRREETTGL